MCVCVRVGQAKHAEALRVALTELQARADDAQRDAVRCAEERTTTTLRQQAEEEVRVAVAAAREEATASTRAACDEEKAAAVAAAEDAAAQHLDAAVLDAITKTVAATRAQCDEEKREAVTQAVTEAVESVTAELKVCVCVFVYARVFRLIQCDTPQAKHTAKLEEALTLAIEEGRRELAQAVSERDQHWDADKRAALEQAAAAAEAEKTALAAAVREEVLKLNVEALEEERRRGDAYAGLPLLCLLQFCERECAVGVCVNPPVQARRGEARRGATLQTAVLEGERGAARHPQRARGSQVGRRRRAVRGCASLPVTRARRGNIRVYCRVRPVLDLERRRAGPGQDVDVTTYPCEDEIIVKQVGWERGTRGGLCVTPPRAPP